jgi:MFS family permease
VFLRIGGDTFASKSVAAIHDPPAARAVLVWKHFQTRGNRRALLVGIVLAVLQQWSGINVIFNYAEDIYRSAGYGVSGALFNIVITGAINVIFTLAALPLVDRWGRRPLLIFGFTGIGLSHLCLALAYQRHVAGLPILLLTLSAIACYAVSLAPVTWVVISEIFPNAIRGTGVAVAVTSLWLASFLLTFTFPVLTEALGSAGTFLTYGVICLFGLGFALGRVVETKGKSLEQIEADLSKKAAAENGKSN